MRKGGEMNRMMARRMLCGSLIGPLLLAGFLVGGSAATAHTYGGGDELWVARYRAGAGTDDFGAVVTSPDGSRVFVTGASQGSGTAFDYATAAYDASSGDTHHLLSAAPEKDKHAAECDEPSCRLAACRVRCADLRTLKEPQRSGPVCCTATSWSAARRSYRLSLPPHAS
jgi:hypothetical protein